MTRKDLREQRECWGEEEWSQRRHHETQSEQDGKYIGEVNEPWHSTRPAPHGSLYPMLWEAVRIPALSDCCIHQEIYLARTSQDITQTVSHSLSPHPTEPILHTGQEDSICQMQSKGYFVSCYNSRGDLGVPQKISRSICGMH